MPLKTAKKGGSPEGRGAMPGKGERGKYRLLRRSIGQGKRGCVAQFGGKREEARMADFYT